MAHSFKQESTEVELLAEHQILLLVSFVLAIALPKIVQLRHLATNAPLIDPRHDELLIALSFGLELQKCLFFVQVDCVQLHELIALLTFEFLDLEKRSELVSFAVFFIWLTFDDNVCVSFILSSFIFCITCSLKE